MIANQIISEFSSPLLLRESATQLAQLLYANATNNKHSNIASIKAPEIPKLHANMICSDCVDSDSDPFASYAEGSVVILPIIGMMFKYNCIDWNEYRWVIGMDTIANLIRLADESPNIAGTICLQNTPGGSTQSIYQLEDALRNRKKPNLTLIDGMSCSGGVYVSSFSNEIHATNRMCEIGSIGTFAKVLDDSKYLEMNGFSVKAVYPPESKWKNQPIRTLLETGDEKPLIDEKLTPFALHFQNIVKANRPNLDLTVEGIIEGREFYAYDAVKNGLIDGIMNIDGAVARVQALAQEQKQFYSQFKN